MKAKKENERQEKRDRGKRENVRSERKQRRKAGKGRETVEGEEIASEMMQRKG